MRILKIIRLIYFPIASYRNDYPENIEVLNVHALLESEDAHASYAECEIHCIAKALYSIMNKTLFFMYSIRIIYLHYILHYRFILNFILIN